MEKVNEKRRETQGHMARKVLKLLPPYSKKNLPLLLRGVDLSEFAGRMQRYGYVDRILDDRTIEIMATDEQLLEDIAEVLRKANRVLVERRGRFRR